MLIEDDWRDVSCFAKIQDTCKILLVGGPAFCCVACLWKETDKLDGLMSAAIFDLSDGQLSHEAHKETMKIASIAASFSVHLPERNSVRPYDMKLDLDPLQLFSKNGEILQDLPTTVHQFWRCPKSWGIMGLPQSSKSFRMVTWGSPIFQATSMYNFTSFAQLMMLLSGCYWYHGHRNSWFPHQKKNGDVP